MEGAGTINGQFDPMIRGRNRRTALGKGAVKIRTDIKAAGPHPVANEPESTKIHRQPDE
jgi:hypothetical protein